MAGNNFYSDIKESIERYFSFLSEFGFSKFEEKQLAYELHFEAKNNYALIDISFEAIPSTPIWAKINGYYIDNLELKNSKIEDYKARLKENYDDLFEQYLRTNNDIFLDKIAEKYIVNGKTINDKYLAELGEILKRHISILNGDFEILISNTEILRKEHESKKITDRIKSGTYTLEYQFLSNDDYDAFEEFSKLKDIEKYLSERNEIKKYRILDCNMNEISLKV